MKQVERANIYPPCLHNKDDGKKKINLHAPTEHTNYIFTLVFWKGKQNAD